MPKIDYVRIVHFLHPDYQITGYNDGAYEDIDWGDHEPIPKEQLEQADLQNEKNKKILQLIDEFASYVNSSEVSLNDVKIQATVENQVRLNSLCISNSCGIFRVRNANDEFFTYEVFTPSQCKELLCEISNLINEATNRLSILEEDVNNCTNHEQLENISWRVQNGNNSI
jgi:hypothetical protein